MKNELGFKLEHNRKSKQGLKNLTQMKLIGDENTKKSVEALCEVQVLVENNNEIDSAEMLDDHMDSSMKDYSITPERSFGRKSMPSQNVENRNSLVTTHMQSPNSAK